MKFFIFLFLLNCCPENGSVYFVVRAAVEAATKRKPPKGRKKTMLNYAPTERHRKAKRTYFLFRCVVYFDQIINQI